MPMLIVAVILGLVQGLGEFLPVSSSGHLVLAQAIFGLDQPEVAFDVVLHLGTLLAVAFFYRRTIFSLICELRFLPGALASPARMRRLFGERPDFRFGVLIIIGSLPTALIGLLFKGLFMRLFDSVTAVGLALIVTGLLLYFSGRFRKGRREAGDMTVRDALVIGLAQGLAITPGFSRSGFTICAGLSLGLQRELAARYSFIMSIPAILGALALEAGGGLASEGFTASAFILGFLAAAVSGYFALKFLMAILKADLFPRFAWWCWGVGLTAVIWSVI